MTSPLSPPQSSPAGDGCLLGPLSPAGVSPLHAALDLVAARLAEDRQACADLADVLRQLGRRPEDDPDYLRWSRTAAELGARLTTALAGR